MAIFNCYVSSPEGTSYADVKFRTSGLWSHGQFDAFSCRGILGGALSGVQYAAWQTWHCLNRPSSAWIDYDRFKASNIINWKRWSLPPTYSMCFVVLQPMISPAFPVFFSVRQGGKMNRGLIVVETGVALMKHQDRPRGELNLSQDVQVDNFSHPDWDRWLDLV